jgi:type I restriction enzyme S subunit
MNAEELRKSVLQMAIQGKLVPQDPEDESASFLIKRIVEEKKELIKQGIIKDKMTNSFIFKGSDNSYYEKIGNHESCIDEEIPFEIPDSWCWVRFGVFVTFNLGKTPERKESKFWKDGSFSWVSISDMIDHGIITKTKEKITNKALKEKFSGKLVPKGTLLMSFKLTIGKISLLGIDAQHNEAIISIFTYCDSKNIIRNYLFQVLASFTSFMNTTEAIKGATLNSTKLNQILIAVPPINEQLRIVNKIKEIEPFLGHLKELENEELKLYSLL